MPQFTKTVASKWYLPGTPAESAWHTETIVVPDKNIKKIDSVTVSPASDRHKIEILDRSSVSVSLTNPTSSGVVGYRDPDGTQYINYVWRVTVQYSVNQPPSKPGSIVYKDSVLGDSDVSVQWGSSTDPDGNLAGYEVEANIGGAGWNRVGRTGPSTLSYSYRVVKGSASVQFRVRAFDSEGLNSDYVSGPVATVINNQGPIITPISNVGELGARNLEFSYVYQVEDPDVDMVRVEESLNGIIFKTQANVPQKTDITTKITDAQISGLRVNALNTVTIKATDGFGNTSYKYIKFTRTNRAPVITSDKYDLGQVLQSFEHVVNVSDPDGDVVGVIWSINGKEIGAKTVIGEGSVTVSVPAREFAKLKPGVVHLLRVEAKDDKDGVSARNFSFVRVVERVHVLYRHNSAAIDAQPAAILVVPTWKIAPGAFPIVLVSNNADDESPVWEDATTVVLAGTRYPFTNAVKSAANWKVGIQVKIEKGSSTDMSYLSGLGGAIE